jgi:hypothetical protein
MKTAITALCAFFVFLSHLDATQVIIINPSFESNIVPMDGNPLTVSPGDDFTQNVAATGWQIGSSLDNPSGLISLRSNSFFDDKLADTPDPVDNDQAFYTNGWDIYQVLSATLSANSTYTLNINVGDRNDNPPSVFYAGLRIGTGTTFGANLITPDSSFTPAAPDGEWAEWTYTFSTGAASSGLGQALRIELLGDVIGTQAIYDNVRLDVVPEPSGICLAIVGLVFAMHRRRRGLRP